MSANPSFGGKPAERRFGGRRGDLCGAAQHHYAHAAGWVEPGCKYYQSLDNFFPHQKIVDCNSENFGPIFWKPKPH